MIQAPDLTRRLRATLAAALITGVLAAGCGSDDGASSASSTTGGSAGTSADSTTTTAASDTDGSAEADSGACDIVSDEVVAEVLGVEIVRREGSNDPASGGASCIKGTERQADLANAAYVSVGVVPGGTALLDEAGAEEGSQPVAGLGDRAVYLPSAGALFIADGIDLVQVQVVKAGVPAGQQDCVTVANDVLSRRS